MSSNLKETLKINFDKHIINVNGIEYINMDVFQSAVSEVAVLEALIGTIALKLNKNIEVSESEAIDYVVNGDNLVNISLEKGVYKICLNKS